VTANELERDRREIVKLFDRIPRLYRGRAGIYTGRAIIWTFLGRASDKRDYVARGNENYEESNNWYNDYIEVVCQLDGTLTLCSKHEKFSFEDFMDIMPKDAREEFLFYINYIDNY
jgi:hypothetical protein